jgi:DNA-binding transcriptional LysR family regulator
MEGDYFHMASNTVVFDGMIIFCEVVEADGFAAAARKLGHSASHVSKEIARLEQRLGTRLLNRTTRRISPTEAGRIYYESARQILSDAREAEQRMLGVSDRPFGQLRVSAPVIFCQAHLNGWLPEFLTANPGVQLRLEASEQMVDMVSEGFDVVLRPRDHEVNILRNRNCRS